MPRVRSVLTVQQKKYEGQKVWTCGVEECDYYHDNAQELDNHLGSEHPTECIASAVLWLNRRGGDVVPEHCPCVCSRQVVLDNGYGSEETRWVRVCNVVSNLLQVFAIFLPGSLTADTSSLLRLQILDQCMECVIKDVGEEVVYGPRDEEQEAQLVAALSKWPTGDLYAL
ncbi:hypothetical protein WJX77_004079 [Trebouxia sp. C0004]